MPTTYAGSSNFAALVTLPSDGDPRSAASISAPIQTLRDDDVYLKAQTDALFTLTGAFRSTNWIRNTTSIGALLGAVWNDVRQSWILFGTAGNFRESFDQGLTWSNALGTALNALGVGAAYMGDVAPDGTTVVSDDSNFVARISASGVTTRPTIAPTNNPPSAPVSHDPISGLWCWHQGNAGGSKCYTSSDGTTWTLRAGPWPSTTPGALASASNKLGRTVALGDVVVAGTSKRLEWSYSDDGGVTWSTLTTQVYTAINTGYGNRPRLSYVGDSTWLLALGSSGASPSGELWKSTDNGVTFARLRTFASTNLGRIASYGSVSNLVATAINGTSPTTLQIMSTDGGATWQKTGLVSPDGTAVGCYVGANGPIALTNASVYMGPRLGPATIQAVT